MLKSLFMEFSLLPFSREFNLTTLNTLKTCVGMMSFLSAKTNVMSQRMD